ncbi:uncharacterized protein LOC117610073 [Osmia lignaria lignaria]|uniref:uncharacterized protein LOC117610073 n=1 Tax=Osmia lignaria lignaria TaxID=1437193 RepID=UPI00402B9D5B
MTEHRGNSFYNSCVKVPVDPYSRQPTPSYERPRPLKNNKDSNCKINFAENDQFLNESEASNSREIVDNFLEFLESIPDYGQVHHLSNEQFKQKVDYLKRKQRLLLENLQDTLTAQENINVSKLSTSKCNEIQSKIKNKNDINDLKLNGKKCYFEESRISSPMFFSSDKFNGLTEDQDLFTNRCSRRDKRNEKVYSASKNCKTLSRLNSDDSMESDIDSIETRSLPASITKEWHPTVPQPFSFTLREEAEKYMANVEIGKEVKQKNLGNNKKNLYRKRRVRSIPLTSKIPLYNKLLAEKEERSRIVREESALNLMSQVRPFRLECDRRAWRSLARSSPELRGRSVSANAKFKAKPVPKNLFSTEIYDRMLEDEYYRQLQKKIRAAQLMKSSSLPPSMARRERVKSTCTRLRSTMMNENTENGNTSRLSSNTSIPLEGYRSMMSLLPLRGNNLAAILRCQMSREKLEREIRDRMEEKRKEQEMKLRESLIGRNPVWRALRSAARHEHERDLNIRTSLRRDEAREQAERHRLQMEMMIDRVTQIPTLFERHSQSYQSLIKAQQKDGAKLSHRRKKKKSHKHASNSVDSYINCENVSRPDSGSITSSSGTSLSTSQSTKSSNTDTSKVSERSTTKSQGSFSKKKGDRSQLKVSINETAELIEDHDRNEKLPDNEHFYSDKHEERVFRDDEHTHKDNY